MKTIRKLIQKVADLIAISVSKIPNDDTALLAIGAMLCRQQYSISSNNINDYEFKIFSQFGDDGIIQFLIKNVRIDNELFIEFGVEDYSESNTRFLMMNNNWSGFVMDGSDVAMNSLKEQGWYWKYSLTHQTAFIDRENINELLGKTGYTDIGLLHIDLDGNDYHILKAIDLSDLNPSIIIVEYNSVFGKDRLITIPYDRKFDRSKSHYSNLFWGASLSAINDAAIKKGYALVGCNLAGNNAYFVRKDLLNEIVKELSVDEAYKSSKYREGRNEDHSLSYISGKERLEVIRGLDVLNIESNLIESL